MKVFLSPEEQFQVSSVASADEVFILDYSGTVDFACALAARARAVTVLDHHRTALVAFGDAARQLPGNLVVELDMLRSGASIALDYFARRLTQERREPLPSPTAALAVHAAASDASTPSSASALTGEPSGASGRPSPDDGIAAPGSARSEAASAAPQGSEASPSASSSPPSASPPSAAVVPAAPSSSSSAPSPEASALASASAPAPAAEAAVADETAAAVAASIEEEEVTAAAAASEGSRASKRRRKRSAAAKAAAAAGKGGTGPGSGAGRGGSSGGGGRGGGSGKGQSPAQPAASASAPKEVIAPLAASRGYTELLGDNAEGGRLLRFVRLIEDGDLYRWWLRDSREFNAGIGTMRLNYDVRTNPGLFSTLRGLDHEKLIASGRSALEGEGRKIDEEIGRAFILKVPEVGIRCLAVRTSWPELRSALGHALAERSRDQGLAAMGIVAYSTMELERKGYMKVSVRAVDGEDTLRLTEKFGGGGHQAASSCNVLKFVFDSWCEEPEA